jgi:magnesium chelatase subunit I
LKETSLEYFSNIESDIIENIKKEFAGKTFVVSQAILGSNSAEKSYENQLTNFNYLSTLVEKIYQKTVSEQAEFVKESQKYAMSVDSLTVSDKSQSELRSGIVELVLEGLCWMEPKILDKKEGTYAAA